MNNFFQELRDYFFPQRAKVTLLPDEPVDTTPQDGEYQIKNIKPNVHFAWSGDLVFVPEKRHVAYIMGHTEAQLRAEAKHRIAVDREARKYPNRTINL